MDLSYTLDGKQAQLSPNGVHVASVSKHVLTIRRADVIANAIAQPFVACDLITYIEWSPDSQYVLCAITLRGKVQIFSISDNAFECTIDQGALQLAHATWLHTCTQPMTQPMAEATDHDSHDSQNAHESRPRPLYVVLYSTHALYASVWSLATQTCAHIANPKFTRQGLDSCALPLSATELYTVGAMVTRHGTRDCVCVFPYDNADLIRTTDTDATHESKRTPHTHSQTDTHAHTHTAERDKQAATTAATDVPNLVQSGNGIGTGNEFVISDSSEVGGVAWNPNGDGTLCVWDGPFGSMVRLYSLEGKKLGECNLKIDYFAGFRNSRLERSDGSTEPTDPHTEHGARPSKEKRTIQASGNGQLTRSESDVSLCIKCVAWAPDGSAVAVGTYADTVVVINTLVWKPLWMARARERVDGNKVAIFLEESDRNGPTARRFYRICTDETTLPVIKQDRHAPSIGTGMVQFSAGAVHMASRCDTQPNVLYIWNLQRFELQSVLIQMEPILHFSWRPHRHSAEIAVSTGNGHVYMWSPRGTAVMTLDIDADARGFACRAFNWGKAIHSSPGAGRGEAQQRDTNTRNTADGNKALAVDVDRFIVCHLPPPDPTVAEAKDDAHDEHEHNDDDMSDGSECVEY